MTHSFYVEPVTGEASDCTSLPWSLHAGRRWIGQAASVREGCEGFEPTGKHAELRILLEALHRAILSPVSDLASGSHQKGTLNHRNH